MKARREERGNRKKQTPKGSTRERKGDVVYGFFFSQGTTSSLMSSPGDVKQHGLEIVTADWEI